VPGSFVDRPPGSCPASELPAVLQLAATIRLAGPQGTGICAVLAAPALYNARRDAADSHWSCGRAAIAPAANGYVTAAERISQPLAGVLLDSSKPGAPRWYGFLSFMNPVARAHPRDPRYEPLTVAIVKRPDGRWVISQIGYEF
jgi:hypothetical protein